VLGVGVWKVSENIFNAVFLVELLVNMYAFWFWQFWISSWNIFDFVVVVVGCISFFVDMVGPLKLLRTLRALRVFRLFKRVQSLKRIIAMIVAALPGVAHAFVVMILCISIYALVAVEFFSLHGTPTGAPTPRDGEELTGLGTYSGAAECSYRNMYNATIESVTARGICYGEEYFGTFSRAWFTLFQVLTGESWSEVVARPILFGWVDYGGASHLLSTLFFMSFVLLNTFILFNVFVAVLLDKMMTPVDKLTGSTEGDGDNTNAKHGAVAQVTPVAPDATVPDGSRSSSTRSTRSTPLVVGSASSSPSSPVEGIRAGALIEASDWNDAARATAEAGGGGGGGGGDGGAVGGEEALATLRRVAAQQEALERSHAQVLMMLGTMMRKIERLDAPVSMSHDS
jgi:hypothetical protein